jgi:hypothetical protein
MTHREWSEEQVQRMVKGLAYPHLRGLQKCWLFFKNTKENDYVGDYFVMYDEPAPGVRHLRIHEDGCKAPIHNFMDMQEIKNTLWGEETIAVEVYPPASQFKDGSNTYHLWTWPDIEFPNLKTLYEYAPCEG